MFYTTLLDCEEGWLFAAGQRTKNEPAVALTLIALETQQHNRAALG